jgi:hypothetical protein
MTTFMSSFEQLARAVADGNATWAEARSWAERTSEKLCSARDALADWEQALGEHFYHGGEERAERALGWRSQHAIVRALFSDTPADELLAAHEDQEVDRDLRDRAERLALDRPSWASQTHSWWRSQ